MSTAEEIQLGKEAAEGIEKEKNLKFIHDEFIHDYVGEIFRRIVMNCRRTDLPYSMKIVDTREINAFALPGGFVYLNRGLMQWANSESELVAALSHEVGHVVGHHGANNISRQTTADSLITEASQVIFGDDLPARLLKQAGGPVIFLANMKFSREEETQADVLGYYNMQRAGWDPRGMLALFQRFAEQDGAFDPFFTITASHPSGSERKARIDEEMRNNPPRGRLIQNSEDFLRMQAVLKRMPPPAIQSKLINK
jgi:predicted Zn-dependent protease